MKNLNFKNFNYAMIDSARSGYREVLVTYTIDGKTARKCVFVKEVKGKDKNYYLAQAKKEINASIKDGSLAKSASKQLALGGASKPVLIALSCVLAAGALGTGGYFLGSYLGGNGGGDNPGPGPVETTYTVALHAGTDGYFNQPGTLFVILENVAKGTALNAISGYALPKSDYEMDFDYWQVGSSDVKFGESEAVTSDLVLTAYFKDNLTSTRNKAKKEIYSVYENVKNSVDPVAEKDLISLLKTMVDDLDKSDSILNTTESIDLVKNVSGFAIKSMYTITYADSSARNQLYDVYQGKIADIAETSESLSPLRASILAKMSDAYIVASVDEDADDDATDKIYNEVMNAIVKNTSVDEKTLEPISYFIENVIKVGSYIPTSADELYGKLFNSIVSNAQKIAMTKEKYPTDTFLVETLGKLTNNYYKAIANASDISKEFVPISTFYELAFKTYPGETFAQKETYKLLEECMESLATSSQNISLTAELYSQVIMAFQGWCKDPAIGDDSNKVAVMENLCKSGIKAVGNLAADSDTLIKGIMNSMADLIVVHNFNQYAIDFSNMIMEVATKMPKQKSAQEQAGAGYATLFETITPLIGLLKKRIEFEPKTEDDKKMQAAAINCIMELGKEVAESTRHSAFVIKLMGQTLPALEEHYKKTLTMIDSGKVTASIESEALVVGGCIREISRTYGEFNTVSSAFSNINGVVAKLLNQVLPDIFGKQEDNELIYAKAFSSSLSKSFYDFRAFFLKTQQPSFEEYCSYVNKNISQPAIKIREMSLDAWKNYLKISSLFLDSENFFYVETVNKDGELVANYDKVLERYPGMSGAIDEMYKLGIDTTKFDQILPIWQNDFFAKVTSTTTIENVNKIFAAAREKVLALLNNNGF